MKEKMLLFLSFFFLVYSNPIVDINDTKLKKIYNQTKKDFSYLNKQKSSIDVFKQFSKYKPQDKDFIKKGFNYAISNYQGDNFLSRNEFLKVAKKTLKVSKFLNRKREVLLFFFSSSMPKMSIIKTAEQVGILRKNNIDIETKQFLIGFPKNFKDYVFDIKEFVYRQPNKVKKVIVDNIHIKVNPLLFKKFHIKKVPLIVLATCNSRYITDNCRFKYAKFGNSGLIDFFDKISKHNKKYKKYSNILLTNDWSVKNEKK